MMRYKVYGTCPRYMEGEPNRGNDLSSEDCGPLLPAAEGYPDGVRNCVRAIQVAANVQGVGACKAEDFPTDSLRAPAVATVSGFTGDRVDYEVPTPSEKYL